MLKSFDYLLVFALFFSFLFLLNFAEAKQVTNVTSYQQDISVSDRNGWIDIDYSLKTKDANINYSFIYRILGSDYNYPFYLLPQNIKQYLGITGTWTDLNNSLTNSKFGHRFIEPNIGHLKRFIWQIKTNDTITISGNVVSFANTKIDFSDVDSNGYAVSILKWSDTNVEVIAVIPDSNSAIILDPVVAQGYALATRPPFSKVARSITDGNIGVVWASANAPSNINFSTSKDGNGWGALVLTASGERPSIDVNSTGGWVIAYQSSATTINVATCSKDCNVNTANWITSNNLTGDDNPSVLVGADNNIYVVFQDGTATKYSQCTNTGQFCSTPITIPNVTANGEVVTAFDINSTGGKGILGGTTTDLNAAFCSGDCNVSAANWLNGNIITSITGTDPHPSLLASGDGNWHLVYNKTIAACASNFEVTYKRCAGDCSVSGNWSADFNASGKCPAGAANHSQYPTMTVDGNSNLYFYYVDYNTGALDRYIFTRKRNGTGVWDNNAMRLAGTLNYNYPNLRRRMATVGGLQIIDLVDVNGENVIFFDANGTGTVGAEAPTNNVVDVNAVKLEGYGLASALKIFTYSIDGNLTIDFNVYDRDWNGIFYGKGRLDANIDFRNVSTGSSTRIITDLNLMATATAGSNGGLYCNDLNFSNDRNGGTTCHWDWNISQTLMAVGNFWIDINVTDNNGSSDTNTFDSNVGVRNQFNNVVDMNVVKVDGNSTRIAMRYYSYAKDGNLTIDFNVYDKDWNGIFYGKSRLDANIAFRDTNGLTTRIITDLNLVRTSSAGSNVGLYCNDLNFANDRNGGTTCHWDWNIALVTDRNVFIDINITDNNGSTDLNFSDFNFGIDNTKPTITVRQPTDKNSNTTSNIITFDVNDNGGSGVRLNSITVDINNVRSNAFAPGTHCTEYGDDYYCTYGENDLNIADTNYNINIFATDDANNSVADSNYLTIIYTGGVTLIAAPNNVSVSVSASTGIKTQGVTITNTGTSTSGTLNIINSCSVSLASVSKTTLSPIAPNGSDNYTITFTPTGTGGTYNCTITVSNTDASTATAVEINETTGTGDDPSTDGGGGPPGPAPTAPAALPGPKAEEYQIESIRVGLQGYEVGKTIKLMLSQGTTETMQITVKNLTDKKFDAFNLTSDCGDIIRIEPTPGLFTATGEPLLDTTIDANSTKTLTIQLRAAAERKEEEIKCSIFAQKTEIPLELQIVRRTLFSDLRNIFGVRFFGLSFGLIGLIISGIVTAGIIDSMRKKASALHALFALVFIGIMITIITSGVIF